MYFKVEDGASVHGAGGPGGQPAYFKGEDGAGTGVQGFGGPSYPVGGISMSALQVASAMVANPRHPVNLATLTIPQQRPCVSTPAICTPHWLRAGTRG